MGTEEPRKPISGIITGHHVLPYVPGRALTGTHSSGRSVECAGAGSACRRASCCPVARTVCILRQTKFSDRQLLTHQALVARVFSFGHALKVLLESEDLRIQRQDRAPPGAHSSRCSTSCSAGRSHQHGDHALSPDVRYYPVVSIHDRFIREILTRSSRVALGSASPPPRGVTGLGEPRPRPASLHADPRMAAFPGI